MIQDLLVVVGAALVFMAVVFVIAQYRQRLDVVDAAWGLVFIVIALSAFARGEQQIGWNIATVVTILVIIWGLRLSLHIYPRLLGIKEDYRYQALRKKWRGNVAINAYIKIFLVQSGLALLVSASVIVTNFAGQTLLGWWTVVGIVVWLVGFLFESIGDAQLKNHLANPINKGKLMTSGLWHYTRHPNYFGEVVQWWGVFIIGLSVPFGWIGVIGPVTITVLLLFVSGIPLTEKRFAGRPGWEAYKKRTSIFIPLPAKEKSL